MVSRTEELAALYMAASGRGRDVSFADFLRHASALDDRELAELIESDGRLRLERGLPVRLDRYLHSVDDLPGRPASLDAAIDITLRSLASSGHSADAGVEALVAQYPALADAIFDAALLNKALMSTQRIQEQLAESPRHRDRVLPQDIGPLIVVQEHGDGDEAEPVERSVPRYRLEEVLGEGTFGRVYRAVDQQLSEEGHPARVAVKVLSPPRDGSGQPGSEPGDHRASWARHRLTEEATKARRVDHPNVVRVLDRGVSDEDEDFIVYELVEGGDLERLLQQCARDRRHTNRIRAGLLRPCEAAAMMARIARGVQAAHAAGLVHCDLQPGNITLTTAGEPKVADFGIAIRRFIAPEATQRPADPRANTAGMEDAGAAIGTPHASHPIGNLAFISPEQYRMEEGSLTIPSDIYALGGMLYFMLTGRLPNGSSIEAIARTHHPDPKVGRSEPPRLRDVQPDVDRDLECICRRAMALRPQDRYSSAGALADDLEAWLRHEPLSWTKPSPLHVARLWVWRKPAVAAVTALLAFAVLTAAIVVNHYSREADRNERRAVENELLAAQNELLAAEEAAAREIERIRADAEAERRVFAARHLRRMNDRLVKLRENRSTLIFPLIWIMEYVSGPDVMQVPVIGAASLGEELAAFRLDAVRGLVEQADERGTMRDLDAMLWRTTLAFWLISSGEPERAEHMLDDLRPEWAEMLRPEDRWLNKVDAMRACAVVRGFARRAHEGALEPHDLQRVLQAEAMLFAAEAAMAVDDPGNSLHHLVLDTMEMLYAPEWLDEPEKLSAVVERRTSP